MDIENTYPVLVYEHKKVVKENGKIIKIYLFSLENNNGIEIDGPAASFCHDLLGKETLKDKLTAFLSAINDQTIKREEILAFLKSLGDRGYIKFNTVKA